MTDAEPNASDPGEWQTIHDRVAGHAVLAGTPYLLLTKTDGPGYETAPVLALPQGDPNL